MNNQVLETPTFPPAALPRPRYVSLRLQQGVSTNEVFVLENVENADEFTYELLIGCNDGSADSILMAIPLDYSSGSLTLSLGAVETDEVIYTLLLTGDSCADPLPRDEDNEWDCSVFTFRIVATAPLLTPEVIGVGPLQACATADGLSRARWIPIPFAISMMKVGTNHRTVYTYYVYEQGKTEAQNFDSSRPYPKGTIVKVGNQHFVAGCDISPGTTPAPPPPPPPEDEDGTVTPDLSSWDGPTPAPLGVDVSIEGESTDDEGVDLDAEGDGDAAGGGE